MSEISGTTLLFCFLAICLFIILKEVVKAIRRKRHKSILKKNMIVKNRYKNPNSRKFGKPSRKAYIEQCWNEIK